MTAADISTAAVARRATAYIVDRAAAARSGHDGDWRNLDVRAAFLRAIDGITVYAEAPGVVVASAADTHHGRVWAYVARDALRAARPDGATIIDVDHTTFRLTFTRRPLSASTRRTL